MYVYIVAKIISSIVIIALIINIAKKIYQIRTIKNIEGKSKMKRAYIEIGVTIVIAVVTFILTFIVSVIHIEGKSMEPNFKDNQFVLLNMINREYEPGDVIVFYCPDRGKNLIKRVIATEGDTVEVKDLLLYINDKVYNEDYNTIEFSHDFKKVTVPKGKLFVMGDNRPISLDSRYDEVGFINPNNIEGKVITFNNNQNSS